MDDLYPIKRASRNPSGRRGNSMVETALIFIPMLVMFFGIVDVSLVVFLQNTLQNAVQAGTRFAITFNSTYGGNSCAVSQAVCIAQVVQDNAFGFLAGAKSNLVTVNYYTAGNLGTPVETCNAGACLVTGALPQTLPNGMVVNYANQPGNVVEVVVANYPWNWIFPVSATTGSLTATAVNLSASSMNVLGGLAVGVTAPPNP